MQLFRAKQNFKNSLKNASILYLFFEILLGSEQLQNMNGLKGKILEEKQKSYRTEMVSPIWMVPSLMTLVKIPWVGMMHLPTFC